MLKQLIGIVVVLLVVVQTVQAAPSWTTRVYQALMMMWAVKELTVQDRIHLALRNARTFFTGWYGIALQAYSEWLMINYLCMMLQLSGALEIGFVIYTMVKSIKEASHAQ